MDAPITLITGTRKGIGRQLAEHYLDAGHQVEGCSRSEPDDALLSREGYCHHILDVGDESAVAGLFSDLRKRHGRLDHLINNAGIASMNHSLLTPASTVARVLETNVLGTFNFCRAAAKLMKKKHFGRIVNFSTVAVPLVLEGEAAYVASKAAVESLSRVLARELADLGITVNTIGPVPIATDLVAGIPQAKLDALVARQAIPRMGSFEDVKNVIDFFLRKESGFITGQILYLGGVS